MKLVKHCIYDRLHVLSPAHPMLKKTKHPNTGSVRHIDQHGKPVGMGAGPSLPGRVRGLAAVPW